MPDPIPIPLPPSSQQQFGLDPEWLAMMARRDAQARQQPTPQIDPSAERPPIHYGMLQQPRRNEIDDTVRGWLSGLSMPGAGRSTEDLLKFEPSQTDIGGMLGGLARRATSYPNPIVNPADQTSTAPAITRSIAPQTTATPQAIPSPMTMAGPSGMLTDALTSTPFGIPGTAPMQQPTTSAGDGQGATTPSTTPVGQPLQITPPTTNGSTSRTSTPDSVPETSLWGRLSASGGPLDRLGTGISNNGLTLMALGAGMAGAPSMGTGISRGLAGAVPAAQADQKMLVQNQTAKFLMTKMPGLSHEQALGIAGSPAILNQLIPQLFGTKAYQHITTKDMLGNEKIQIFDPVTGRVSNPVTTASAESAPGQQSISNFDMSKVDQNKQGWDYAKQYPQEVQDAAKAYMNGGVMPTGNQRMNSIAGVAKMVAQKVAADLGQPHLADDALFPARRKMRVDLASSSASSTGGIISNGKSAFEHLANLSDKFVDLGNRSGPDVMGGGHIGSLANWMGNVVLPTGEIKGKVQAANDNALKYGQEATKFYAGSGGGEAERMAALRATNPGTTTAAEQASYLQTEKELMLGRLKQKEEQIRDVLGEQFLSEHPVMTRDLHETLAKIDGNIARLRSGSPAARSNAPAVLPANSRAVWSPDSGVSVVQ